MKRMFLLIVLFLLVSAIPSQAFGAWWLEKYVAENRIEIPDKEIEFTLDNIKCVISETRFNRMPDDYIVEHRDLTCWLANDTSVRVMAHCEKGIYTLTSLFIDKNGKSYSPSLYCGKKK